MKLTGFQLLKKFSAFYGTRLFITVFTRARHLSQSSATWIHYTPSHAGPIKSILIFFHLYHQNPAFPIRFTCPTHLIPRNLMTVVINIWWEVQIMEFVIVLFRRSSCYFVWAQILSSVPISHIFGLYSFINSFKTKRELLYLKGPVRTAQ